MNGRRKLHLNSPIWPEVITNSDQFDGLIPSARVKSWQHYISLVNEGSLGNQSDDMLFRGQRNGSWALTPSISRLSKTGTYSNEIAEKQLENFKFSIRGRTKIPVSQLQPDDVWAIGQHYGLWTPLLDWSHSPFVAMFFALNEPDPKDEKPKNHSRAIFRINKTKLAEHLNESFVDPLSSDHDRLISQDGLFTISPSGEVTLENQIITTLAENDVDVDNHDVLKEYICKIHIPLDCETERKKAVLALRRMNLHYANLYPDLLGSSMHCNELIREAASKNDCNTSKSCCW
ncbi:FRG domain [Serratia entomophila]|uniref:FRG domain-containing protein n=1 Tax=Serratia entomophila TaxID=42906 RepID=UPI002178E07A|nr:FRG domain-containing protein [Serratia entomophila]CAI1905683.1 FRG domain [Serratia entomophila]